MTKRLKQRKNNLKKEGRRRKRFKGKTGKPNTTVFKKEPLKVGKFWGGGRET